MDSSRERWAHFLAVNKRRWNELVQHHVNSEFYDLKGFLNGKITLSPIEKKEIGSLIKNKLVLHLQCHFGLDSFSLERLGAKKVIGVDFSEKAIALANLLKKQLGSANEFICANVYSLPEVLAAKETMDVVFTSHGVLPWLPNLERWAEIISFYLKKGGHFYIIDTHPFASMIDDEREDEDLVVRYPYFGTEEPFKFVSESSYASSSRPIKNQTAFEWFHSLSEIINSLLLQDLEILFFHEFPVMSWKKFAFLRSIGENLWGFEDETRVFPLTFSLLARKI